MMALANEENNLGENKSCMDIFFVHTNGISVYSCFFCLRFHVECRVFKILWCVKRLFFNKVNTKSLFREWHTPSSVGIFSFSPFYSLFSEICFPQKYMNLMQPDGVRPVAPLFLFSSEGRPNPQFAFPPCGDVDFLTRLGLYLSGPAFGRECDFKLPNRREKKGE
jgi:hypothetical protein